MGMLGTLMRHPDEIPPLLKLKIAAMQAQRAIPNDPNLAFCYRMLTRVSRSFSIVIQQLRPELRDAICVFYLVLRGLDTIEDDMAIPIEIKVPILKTFHKHIYDPSWKFICGEKNYKELMNKFELVSNAFLNLEEGYQSVIAEMTDRMGNGMAKFIESEVITVDDYDEYCHYVAGLVGLGLSRLFHASGLEEFQPDDLSNSMGLFLQKTNIIRDYLEDINEIPAPRMFWPHEIWGKFGTKLEDFKHEDNSENAVKCLNAMITNALTHAIDCLRYMEAIEDEDNLRFCAIPQIMAIATLAECYNNINVFRGVVKIRRGITAKIMQMRSMDDVHGAFFDFSKKIARKIDDKDPSARATRKHIENIMEHCELHFPEPRVFSIEQETGMDFLLILVVLMLVGLMMYMLYNNW
ncbi:hypothetical protein M758_1G329000 [Ceratodon purpureus]|nr:hypothetical protein M758_1G329000 [Ceratodon purpureus]